MRSSGIPPLFAQRVRTTLGDRGAEWLRALPSVVADLSARWSFTVGEPYALSYNYVARARRHDGTEAVLKIGAPWGDGELTREIHALRLYAGHGICGLLESDLALQAMLLERLRPGEMLRSVARADDDVATEIGAGVMQRLWKVCADLPDPGLFRPLAAWFQAFPRHRACYGGPGPFPPAILSRAEAVVAHLLASAPATVLLHADLHHDNVLSSDRDGWLAIDPKGMLGDPGYEVGPFLLNPDPGGSVKSPAQLARRLDILADALAYDRRRLRDWGIAHAVLSACWTAENDGDGWQAAIATAENLMRL